MARKAQSKPEKTVETVKQTKVAEESQQAMVSEEVTEVHIPLSACGGALRAAREKQKLSVQDIASQLRLGVRQVEALEADRYDKLPEPSIVRGFIRNYAKLLKIDSSPILAAYGVLVPNTTPQSFAVKSTANASIIGENRAHFSIKSFVGLLLTFAFVVWFFYYYTQVIKPNVASDLTKINAPAIEADTTTSNTEFALPAAERQPDTVTAVELPTPEASVSNTPPVAADNNLPITTDASQATAQTQPTPPPAASVAPEDSTAINVPSVKPSIAPAPIVLPSAIEQTTSQPTAVETKSAQLVIDATEETWVNITDSSGKQVYSKVIAAGSSESLRASPPLSITVGNAQATAISVNGKPLDLLAHTRDRVARIKVN